MSGPFDWGRFHDLNGDYLREPDDDDEPEHDPSDQKYDEWDDEQGEEIEK